MDVHMDMNRLQPELYQDFQPKYSSCDSENSDEEDTDLELFMLLAMAMQAYVDLTNFTLEEFAELCDQVCPTIERNARSSGTSHKLKGRLCKASPEQRLLSFILYMKHDNSVYFDAAHWNWAKSSVCDDAIIVASCLNEAIADEIQWPTAAERLELGQVILNLPKCTGFVNSGQDQ
ncbi:unnamed protein product [Calypogeia fissa]